MRLKQVCAKFLKVFFFFEDNLVIANFTAAIILKGVLWYWMYSVNLKTTHKSQLYVLK